MDAYDAVQDARSEARYEDALSVAPDQSELDTQTFTHQHSEREGDPNA